MDIQPIWDSNGCAGFTCHGTLESGGLKLTAAESYVELVDVLATQLGCNTIPRVDKAGTDPDNSVLVRKIENTGCGPIMPSGANPPLTAGEIQLIRDWIIQGALNN